MFKKKLENIKEGDILAGFIYDDNNILYALPGKKIDNEFLKKVKDLNIDKLIVDFELSDEIDENLKRFQKKFKIFSKRYLSFKQFVVTYIDNLKNYIFQEVFPRGGKSIAGIKYSDALRGVLIKYWDRNISNYIIFSYPLALIGKYNSKLFIFSVQKAIISAIIGVKFKFSEKDVMDLFFASFLSRFGQLVMNVNEVESSMNSYLFYSIFHYSYYLLSGIKRVQVGFLRTIYYSYQRYQYLSSKSYLSMTILRKSQILKIVDYYLSNIKYYDERLDYESVGETLANIYLNAGVDFSVEIVKEFPISRREFPKDSWVKIIDRIYYTNYIGRVIRGNINPKDKKQPKIKVMYNDRGTRLKKPVTIDLAITTLKIVKYYGDYQEV